VFSAGVRGQSVTCSGGEGGESSPALVSFEVVAVSTDRDILISEVILHFIFVHFFDNLIGKCPDKYPKILAFMG